MGEMVINTLEPRFTHIRTFAQHTTPRSKTHRTFRGPLSQPVSTPRSLISLLPSFKPTKLPLSPQPVSSSEGRRTASPASTSTSTDYTSPSSPSSPTSSDGSQTRRNGHYRGMTFDDILPSYMIANAPPPGADEKQQKRRRDSKAPSSSSAGPSRSRGSFSPPSSTTTTATTMEQQQQPRSPSKRDYPSGKKHSSSAGGGRMRATARMLARGLSVVRMKRDSRGRGGYEAV